ncbi:protein SFI1, partial [Tremellales sp. Uapishka_1]
MLGLSTSSRDSGASSSLTDNVDLELIEEIIERAPRTATSFGPVFRSYEEIFKERGLSASRDTTHYNFILKLGIIRAETYGEKWDIWRATNSVASRRESSLDPSDLHSLTASRLASVKSRVPYLASASSNPDDGYAGGTTEDENSVEEGEESYVHQTRPSPRKYLGERVTSRSMVGYTPSQSVEYDLLNLPARTSTPLYAQDYRTYHRGSTPTPPPYTVSDTSKSLDNTYLSDPGTPKPRRGSWTEDAIRHVPDKEEREMDRRADLFFNQGLVVRRCLEMWINSARWIMETNRQIDETQAKIDRQFALQTLQKWKALCERQLDRVNTADNHFKAHLVRRWIVATKVKNLETREKRVIAYQQANLKREVLRRWRVGFVRKRTREFEKDLKIREKTFIKQSDSRLFLEILTQWRERRADMMYDRKINRKILQNTLEFWRHLSHLRQVHAEYQARQNDQITRAVFNNWRKMTALPLIEEKVVLAQETRLIKRVWEQWRISTVHMHNCRTFNEKGLFRRTWVMWLRRHGQIRQLNRQVVKFSRNRDLNILDQALHAWYTKSDLLDRERTFVAVTAKLFLAKQWKQWGVARSRVFRLEGKGDAFALNSGRKNLSALFSKWRGVSAFYRNLHLQADLYLEEQLRAKTLRKWVDYTREVRVERIKADNCLAFALQRRFLGSWRQATKARWAANRLAERTREEKRKVFTQWRLLTMRKEEERAILAQFQKRQDTRIMRQTMDRITVAVVEIKSREMDVVRDRDQVLLRNAFDALVHYGQKRLDQKNLLYYFIEDSAQNRVRRALRFWHARVKASRERRALLEGYLMEKKEKLLSGAFEVWYDRKREADLRKLEESVEQRHEDYIFFAAMDRWKAKSKRLHAVWYEQERVKRLAWNQWRAAMPAAVKLRRVTERRDAELLQDTFVIWKEEYLKKSAARAIRHRGRIRPAREPARRVSNPATPLPSVARRSTPGVSATPTFETTAPSKYSRSPNAPQQVPIVAGRTHRRISSQHLPLPLPSSSDTVSSEPAYSRLRLELDKRRTSGNEDRRRSGSGEPEEKRGSELLRALRGTLPRK